MTRKPDPAAFRARLLARLSGAPEPESAAVADARRVLRARSTVRNAERRKKLTAREWKSALGHWGTKCVYCGKAVSARSLTKDHWNPLRLGGTLEAFNVVPACGSCNRKKSDTPALEYMVGLGKLVQFVEISNYLGTLTK